MKKSVLAVIAALVASAPAPASANPSHQGKQSQPPSFMRVYGTTPAPYGFVAFCERMPDECVAVGTAESRLEAGPDRLRELDEVNRLVNARIAPTTDLEHFGVIEHWTIPTEKGDCEDYALLKRQILIKRGWPSGALLMTVVRDERGDGHAVLTARTAQGDFILDNKHSELKLWHQTGYRFVMRQSFVQPRLWMSLSPHGAESAPATSDPARR